MPRPVNADADATRRRILESAARRFSEVGLDGASIRDIARNASVSLAMVHHYYGSKDGLYARCVDDMYDELLGLAARLEVELGMGGSLGELVERAVRVGFRFAREHRVAVRLLLRSVVEAGELDAARRDRAQRPFLDRVSALIGGTLDRPAVSLRLPLQSVVLLVARWAISSEAESALVSGGSATEASALVEQHLVDAAFGLLGITHGGAPSTPRTAHRSH